MTVKASYFSSDMNSCPIEGYRVYADSDKKYLIQNDQFYKDDYGIKTTNALSSSFYMEADATIDLSFNKLWERQYYIFAFNNAGASGSCKLNNVVCGEETFTTNDEYKTTPYVYDLAVDTTTGAQKTIEVNFGNKPFSDMFSFSTPSACYQRFMDEADFDLRVYNSGTSSFDITAENHDDISYDLGPTTYPYAPRIYVKLANDQWLKTRLMMTTRGRKVAMAHFDYKIKGPGTLYLANAAENLLTVYN